MNERFSRTIGLIGQEGLDILSNSNVALVGVGGVGGYAAEALIRAGIGRLTVMDGDCFNLSNLNRQLHATLSTIGKNKAETVKARAAEINPDCQVTALSFNYTAETARELSLCDYDYVVDAIDSLNDKALLIANCKAAKVDIISSMGTANRLGTDFAFCDVFETTDCPLARKLRSLLRKKGVTSSEVLISRCPTVTAATKPLPSISFVPAVAGLMLAQKVVLSLLDKHRKA